MEQFDKALDSLIADLTVLIDMKVELTTCGEASLQGLAANARRLKEHLRTCSICNAYDPDNTIGGVYEDEIVCESCTALCECCEIRFAESCTTMLDGDVYCLECADSMGSLDVDEVHRKENPRGLFPKWTGTGGR